MAELADAPDLGSGGRPCRFKSCYPQYQKMLKSTGIPYIYWDSRCFLFFSPSFQTVFPGPFLCQQKFPAYFLPMMQKLLQTGGMIMAKAGMKRPSPYDALRFFAFPYRQPKPIPLLMFRHEKERPGTLFLESLLYSPQNIGFIHLLRRQR